MMSLQIYSGEYFERSRTWFLCFFLVLSVILLVIIFSDNLFGAVFMLLLIGGYFFSLFKISEIVALRLEDDALYFGSLVKKISDFSAFSLEYHRDTQQIHNLVLFSQTSAPMVYTIKDTPEHIVEFVKALSQVLPFQKEYTPSILTVFLRKLKF